MKKLKKKQMNKKKYKGNGWAFVDHASRKVRKKEDHHVKQNFTHKRAYKARAITPSEGSIYNSLMLEAQLEYNAWWEDHKARSYNSGQRRKNNASKIKLKEGSESKELPKQQGKVKSKRKSVAA
jgi:hypothetical protein